MNTSDSSPFYKFQVETKSEILEAQNSLVDLRYTLMELALYLTVFSTAFKQYVMNENLKYLLMVF